MISHSSAIVTHSLNPNFQLINDLADAGNGLVDLWEASPVRLDSKRMMSGLIDVKEAVMDIRRIFAEKREEALFGLRDLKLKGAYQPQFLYLAI